MGGGGGGGGGGVDKGKLRVEFQEGGGEGVGAGGGVAPATQVFAAIYFVDSRFITRNIEMITYSLSNVLGNQS